jgi:sec-independent protein translocase protein TatA
MLPGAGEIAIVVGIALLFFGPKRLPELGKALGEGIGSFQKAINELGGDKIGKK